ncbi:MAG: hypothetical protein RR754_07245, partial [Oscillospiraceae bacterium]
SFLMPLDKQDLITQQSELIDKAEPYTAEEMRIWDDTKDPIRLLATMKAYGEKLEREGRTR